MDSGGLFVKYMLFLFNILFVVCGVLLIVFGSIMVANIGHISNLPQWANDVPIIILVLGCAIFIIAFMGCCGAITENSCLTTTYSVFMLILFLCQVPLIVYVWVMRKALELMFNDFIFWENPIDIIFYGGLGVAVVEMSAFIFACCLADQVRNGLRRANY